jgi:uncharacterized protein
VSATDLLADLADPGCYPHRPREVRIVQTHLSVVCLADDLVYKLKKAIALPFVDFRTLAARRTTCRDEVRLNRRACPDTYLGTAALRRDAAGRLHFAATGDDDGADDLDVAVVMQRLPQARMLDELLREHAVTRDEIEALARHVAAFHARADRGPETLAHGDPRRLAQFAAANFTELATPAGDVLARALRDALAIASEHAFTALLPRLVARAAAGRVVDGHGDLHARNICMTVPPALYDCLEFAPALRCGDVATENAFLAMDLRYRGAPELADAYIAAYATAAGDAELPELLPALCSYRAMVRCKVAALTAGQAELPAADRAGAITSAQRHLLLAAAYLLERHGPRWLVVCGPPASGKTSLCRELAAATAWSHVATDAVRKELAGLAATATAEPEHYSDAFTERTYAEVMARAAAHTQRGERVVLLDGNFASAVLRIQTAFAARTVGARMVVVFVDVDRDTAISRAAARAGEAGNISDADAGITASRHRTFVRPTAAEGAVCVRVDGARPAMELAPAVLAALLALPDHAP